MSEWSALPFREVLSEPVRNGIYKTAEFHGRGAKVVNMGELFAHPRLRSVPMRRVALSPSEQERFLLKPNDLLFARRSLVAEGAGKCSIVLEIEEETTFESSIIRARPNASVADAEYLYYMFNSPLGLHLLDTIRRQVAVAGITGKDLSDLVVPVPPLAEQRAIAGVLGALDDKIEANRRMNATLEAMARALFKSWFVDFDPVRAKMEGRPPALAPDLAALFPARLTDSPLGPIPEGWEVKGLLEVARLISGGTPKTDESAFWDGGIAWASAKDVSQCGQPFLIATERTISKAGLENSSTRLVPAKSTVVVARGATTGRFTMLGGEMAMNQTCYALNCQAGHDFWLNGLFANTIDALVNAAHGSVFDTITTRTIETARVLAPADAVRRAYEEIVKPTYGRLLLNLEQSQVLAQLRDLLLPKLLSGALRVRDAEAMVEDAA